ncbi:MAG: tRNA (N(6)-L-threonylcarbamoyladenosine(37)-C(2))-methylthiotransferase MtaB [Bacteroidetes bacterium]|nr:MAG: tRNA (N(6)-L-threonylcarbamoyladenosine(37)-C(2))-methylthiotransferase MtaB [Bacteroidota bacterium]
MKKVAFFTLGCKLNFAETSTIANSFIENGFEKVNFNQEADVYVINTCTVTNIANKKCRQAINKAIKKAPNAKVVVTGCYAQLKPEELSKIPGVDLVLGNNEKFNISNYLNNSDSKIINSDLKNISCFYHSFSLSDRTRSFLKVQDGCDYYCSYCTIPLARGKSRNAPIKEIIKEAEKLADNNVKEIILTGVNIGDFGKSTNETFIDLIKALDKVAGIKRIRISSIEPNLLTDEVINFVAQSNKIVPHFHIPLQCGTNNLLKLMHRRYTTELYSKKVATIKTIMPQACIAADLIVGVPGETEEEFKKAYQYVDDLDLSYLHIFTYSERDNTLALTFDNKVPVNIRRERSKILHELSEKKRLKFYSQHLNTFKKVLFESKNDNGKMYGFTENYIKVETPYDKQLINQIVKVKLDKVNADGNVEVLITGSI